MNVPFCLSTETLREADLSDAWECARIEEFVRSQDEGSFFHRPAWLKAVERGTGQKVLGLVAEQGGKLAGWLPLSIMHSPIFGRALVSSPFAVGGGILAVGDGLALRLAAAAEEFAARSSCAGVELRGGPIPWHWKQHADSHSGFVASLAADDEAQLQAIPRKQRAEVRKGIAQELTIEIGTGDADRCAHYAVYSESVRNLGTPVFPRALFDAMLDELGECADILTIRHRGYPIASVLSFYDRGAVMPYWGGGTFAARSLRANDRMYFELMLHARRRGCTRFDFGRSKTGSGAYHFKRNWGFAPAPLLYGTWSPPGVAARDVNPASDRYAARVAIWKRLPLSIANRIGPVIARGLG
jgi:FemAB-related protein (PEP-CTERM system-associated)